MSESTSSRDAQNYYLTLIALTGCLCLLPGICAGPARADTADKDPHNIVIVTVDTLRADHLSENGYFRDAAPFINSLAKQGVNFQNAFTCSAHTAPAHASMFTSLYPFEHRVRRNLEGLHRNTLNIASYLQEHGYQVGGFSAVQFMEGRVGFPKLAPEYRWDDTAITDRFWFRNASQNITRAKRWLATKKQDQRLFLWIHFYDVHEWMKRFHLPKEFLTFFDGASGEKMQSALEQQNGPSADNFKKKERFFRANNRYDARLRFADHHLRDLYEYMNKMSFNENTLWIITSDHGEGLNNHRYLYHGEHFYQEQLHVPLIFHSTSAATSLRVKTLVRTVDIFPTVAHLIGKPLDKITAKLRGVSLVPLLTSGKWESEDPFKFSFAERRPRDSDRWHRSWREGEAFSLHNLTRKLIHYTSGTDLYFDLRIDPFELHSSTEHPHYTHDLEQLLRITAARSGSPVDSAAPDYDDEAIKELTALGYL